MVKRAIIGIQRGDEGKSKVIGFMLNGGRSHFFPGGGPVNVARYQGGNNAGHTQYMGGRKYVFHLIPSGMSAPDTYNFIGAGTVIDPLALVEEMDGIEAAGYPATPRRFGVSGSAQVTLEYHKALERAEVARRGGAIAPTMRGIFPTYMDADRRRGINVAEFVDEHSFAALLEDRLCLAQAETGETQSVADYLRLYARARERLASVVVNEGELLYQRRHDHWLFEGAQGMVLDRELGRRPDVTSSNPGRLPANACRIGVAKAYLTAVGAEDPLTKMDQPEEETVRRAGSEYGATTARSRTCAWFDVPAVRQAIAAADIEEIVLTKLDVLAYVGGLRICDTYRRGNEILRFPPADSQAWDGVAPHFADLPGFAGADLSEARNWGDLPPNARAFVHALEDQLERPITVISVGPQNDQTFFRG